MNVYIPYIYVYMASVLLGQWQSANVYIQHTHTSHTRIRVCCTNKYGFHFIDTSLCTQFQSQCEQMCAFLSLSMKFHSKGRTATQSKLTSDHSSISIKRLYRIFCITSKIFLAVSFNSVLFVFGWRLMDPTCLPLDFFLLIFMRNRLDSHSAIAHTNIYEEFGTIDVHKKPLNRLRDNAGLSHCQTSTAIRQNIEFAHWIFPRCAVQQTKNKATIHLGYLDTTRWVRSARIKMKMMCIRIELQWWTWLNLWWYSSIFDIVSAACTTQ